MGYMIASPDRVTTARWSKRGGAGGAPLIDFAPLRHLRHPLIGEGEVSQWSSATTRARAFPLIGGTTVGRTPTAWPTMALA